MEEDGNKSSVKYENWDGSFALTQVSPFDRDRGFLFLDTLKSMDDTSSSSHFGNESETEESSMSLQRQLFGVDSNTQIIMHLVTLNKEYIAKIESLQTELEKKSAGFDRKIIELANDLKKKGQDASQLEIAQLRNHVDRLESVTEELRKREKDADRTLQLFAEKIQESQETCRQERARYEALSKELKDAQETARSLQEKLAEVVNYNDSVRQELDTVRQHTERRHREFEEREEMWRKEKEALQNEVQRYKRKFEDAREYIDQTVQILRVKK